MAAENETPLAPVHRDLGETVAPTDLPHVNIDDYLPTEVVALNRRLLAQELASRTARAEGRQTDYEQTLAPYTRALEQAIRELPQRDEARALAVYAAFADSPSVEDRRYAGSIIFELTSAGIPAGIALWDRLVRDADTEVRDIAYEPLADCLSGEDLPQAEESRQRLGLTWYDVAQLTRNYCEAQRGKHIYSLGSTVLDRFLHDHADAIERSVNRPSAN